MKLQIKWLTSDHELYEMRRDWEDLLESTPEATPFQTPAWLLPWWDSYGEGDLCCLTLWNQVDGGYSSLVCFAPFYFYRGDARPRAVLMGSGNSDYVNVTIKPAYREISMHLFGEALKGILSRCGEIEFQQVPGDSPLLQMESNLPSLLIEKREQDTCCVLDLRPERLPHEMLKKAAYCKRRLSRLGRISLECATHESFVEFFETFERLHCKRRQFKGDTGAFGAARDRIFHRRAARELLISGQLRLYVLKLDEKIIAALYAFARGSKTYFYLSGFDPKFASCSPGTLILGHAVEQSMRERHTHFDFLRGREPYKYRWNTRDHAVWNIKLSRRRSC